MPAQKKANSYLSKTLTPPKSKATAKPDAKSTPKKQIPTAAQKMNIAKTNLMARKIELDAAKGYTRIGKSLVKPNIEKYNRLKGFEAKSGSKSDAREMAKDKALKTAAVGARMQKSPSDLASRAQKVGEASRTYARTKNQRFK
jgi:hypothetical protein